MCTREEHGSHAPAARTPSWASSPPAPLGLDSRIYRAMLGNLARVTNQRGMAPSLAGDEWAVLSGIDNSLGSVKYNIAFFEAADEAYARTLSVHLISSAPGAPIDPSAPSTSEFDAARAPVRGNMQYHIRRVELHHPGAADGRLQPPLDDQRCAFSPQTAPALLSRPSMCTY